MDLSKEKELTKRFPMHVTFDSNTVEYVLAVKTYDAQTMGQYFDPQLSNCYAMLRNAIVSGQIIPYVPEGYFTVEAIEKKQRKAQMGKPAKMTADIAEPRSRPSTHDMTFCISPSVHVKLNPYSAAVCHALEMVGGKVLPCYRIGFPVCDEVKHLHVKFGNGKPTLKDYQARMQQINQYIEGILEGGLKQLKERLRKDILDNPIPIERDNPYYRNSIRAGATDLLFADNNLAPQKVAALIAELADCDMVCEHWAYDNDCICTCDISKGQGPSGILHPDNIKQMDTTFTIRVLSPNELARAIAHGSPT